MGDVRSKYDLIVIGAGPAGLTAGIYAGRYRLKTLIIGQINGGLMIEAHKICNFPTEKDISGFELGGKMSANATAQGVEILNAPVKNIQKTSNGFEVWAADQKSFTTKTLLIAWGTEHRQLHLEREQELLGRGISYCATCDGMFYKDKTVAVIGGGNSALTAALYLSEIAKRVYLLYRGEKLPGEPAWVETVSQEKKIEIILNTEIIELKGEKKIEMVALNRPYQNKELLALDGIFVEIGTEPKQYDYLNQLKIERNENGYIKIDRAQKTTAEGIWAAGDITTGSNNFRQIITAAAEGAIAADAIFKYLKMNG